MPPYKNETRDYHKERIKEILALKPSVTVLAIQEALEKDPNRSIKLSHLYITKLKGKIMRERAVRYDRARVETRLAEIEDQTQSVITQLWKVLLDPRSKDVARVQAGKTIIDAHHKFLQAQMDAGIFERKLGTLEVDNVYHLEPEIANPILEALKNYAIIKRADVIEDPKLPEPSPSA